MENLSNKKRKLSVRNEDDEDNDDYSNKYTRLECTNEDVLTNVFQYLQIDELIQVRKTCKFWNHVSKDPLSTTTQTIYASLLHKSRIQNIKKSFPYIQKLVATCNHQDIHILEHLQTLHLYHVSSFLKCNEHIQYQLLYNVHTVYIEISYYNLKRCILKPLEYMPSLTKLDIRVTSVNIITYGNDGLNVLDTSCIPILPKLLKLTINHNGHLFINTMISEMFSKPNSSLVYCNEKYFRPRSVFIENIRIIEENSIISKLARNCIHLKRIFTCTAVCANDLYSFKNLTHVSFCGIHTTHYLDTAISCILQLSLVSVEMQLQSNSIRDIYIPLYRMNHLTYFGYNGPIFQWNDDNNNTTTTQLNIETIQISEGTSYEIDAFTDVWFSTLIESCPKLNTLKLYDCQCLTSSIRESISEWVHSKYTNNVTYVNCTFKKV
jgi:hypothetical protein